MAEAGDNTTRYTMMTEGVGDHIEANMVVREVVHILVAEEEDNNMVVIGEVDNKSENTMMVKQVDNNQGNTVVGEDIVILSHEPNDISWWFSLVLSSCCAAVYLTGHCGHH